MFLTGQAVLAAKYEYTDPVSKVVYKYWPSRGVAQVKDGLCPEQGMTDTLELYSGNPGVRGDIVILDKFTVDGQEYTVNRIGDCVFAFCGITSVTIPSTVKTIDSYAFYKCKSLASVSFPDGLEYIHDLAFNCCDALSSVVLPEGLIQIADAFPHCSGLKSVSLPSTLKYMYFNPFFDCPNLESITVDGANETFDSRDGCNAVIDTYSDILIAGCGRTVIPSTVKCIGFEAFGKCQFPDGKIVLPESIEGIDQGAFMGTNLKTITIPKGVTRINGGAFYDIPTLESIVSLSEDPCSIYPNGFWSIEGICMNPAVKLYIPAGTRDKYMERGWGNEFETIIELVTDDIQDTALKPGTHAGSLYDMQGRKIVNRKSSKGVYIQDGKKYVR